MIWIVLGLIFGIFLWTLFYQSPGTVIRIGCWLTAWGEARSDMRELHKSTFHRMMAVRHPQKDISHLAELKYDYFDTDAKVNPVEEVITVEELDRRAAMRLRSQILP